MDFKVFGKEGAPSLLLIPGLGVSYEIFLPLIDLLKEKFRIIAVQVDGFTLGVHTRFTSIDDQAAQVIAYVREQHCGRLDCAYGLSLGGKILSRGEALHGACLPRMINMKELQTRYEQIVNDDGKIKIPLRKVLLVTPRNTLF